jgi:peptidoglycan hydrolase CwlO-like protein
LFAWVQQNPLQTIGGIASVGTALFAVIRYYSEAKAKTAALTAQMQSQTTLQNYQGQFQNYIDQKEAQIQQLQTQANSRGSDTLQSALNESQGLVTNQATQIRSLQDQITALNNLIMLKETQVIEKIVVK